MTDQQQFEALLCAGHACISLVTFEEDYALDVVRKAAVERGMDILQWSVTGGVTDGLLEGSAIIADTDHPAAALYYFGHTTNRERPTVCVLLDVAGHLKDERTLRALREAVECARKLRNVIVLIDAQDVLPSVMANEATRFELSPPDEAELESIIKSVLRRCNEQQRILVNVTRADLQTIIRNLRGLSRRQAEQVVLDTVMDDHRFDISDLNGIIARKRRAIGGDGLLEYVEAPVDLTEIGGLVKLKGWLDQRKEALSEEAVAFGIEPPRGLLMLGVQGAGKSLSAKAVATAWKRPLLRMDPGAFYDRYIGESERRLHDALLQAERMSPVILWIDEIEKGFASAASQSSDGGLSKRMFGTLLTWMQEHRAPVFLIATANDIEALPPELLRKGRFDETFFVDLPPLEARTGIFAIHLRKRKRDPAKFDLAELANASEGFSGAEIEQAVIASMHTAFSAHRELTQQDMLDTLKNSPPLSVTMAEKVQDLRDWAKGRCMPAD